MRAGEVSGARSLHGTARPGDTRELSLKPPKWLRKAQPGKILKKAAPIIAGVAALAIPGVGAAVAGAVGGIAKGAAGVLKGAGGAAGSIISAGAGAVRTVGGAAGEAGRTVVDELDEFTGDVSDARATVVRAGYDLQVSASQADRALRAPLSFADSIPGGATTLAVGGVALVLVVVLLATRRR